MTCSCSFHFFSVQKKLLIFFFQSTFVWPTSDRHASARDMERSHLLNVIISLIQGPKPNGSKAKIFCFIQTEVKHPSRPVFFNHKFLQYLFLAQMLEVTLITVPNVNKPTYYCLFFKLTLAAILLQIYLLQIFAIYKTIRTLVLTDK